MAYQHTTPHITRALRRRINDMQTSGVDALDLTIAADELDRLNRTSLDSEDTLASLKRFITETLTNERGQLLMAIQKEVQDLLDAVAAQSSQISAATAEIVTLENANADATAKLAALQAQLASASAPAIGADDLAGIVAATKTVSDSVASLKAAMPQPVAAPVVDAASADPAAPAA